jgi:hypothetical protein
MDDNTQNPVLNEEETLDTEEVTSEETPVSEEEAEEIAE